MNQEAYWDELDRQFKTNIDAITNNVQLLLTIRNMPSEMVQFFDWFSKWTSKTINGEGNPGYPQWLVQLTRMCKAMEKRVYAEDPLARVARMICHLINEISYVGTEEHHVEESRDVLDLLTSILEESKRSTR